MVSYKNRESLRFANKLQAKITPSPDVKIFIYSSSFLPGYAFPPLGRIFAAADGDSKLI